MPEEKAILLHKEQRRGIKFGEYNVHSVSPFSRLNNNIFFYIQNLKSNGNKNQTGYKAARICFAK